LATIHVRHASILFALGAKLREDSTHARCMRIRSSDGNL
jgi:hypothetical protein